MADQPIDKIYIDIEVKNTGLNTLKTATRNLQDIVTDINLKDIDITTTRKTTNTLNRLKDIASNLKEIQNITSKQLVVDIKTAENGKLQTADSSNKQKATQGSITQVLDENKQLISQTTKDINDGETSTTTIDSYRKTLKETTEQIDKTGKRLKVTIDHTKNLTNGITKNNYVIDENGKKWLKTSTYIKQTIDGLLNVKTTYDQLGNEISKVTTLTDRYGNVTTKTSGEVKKSQRSFKSFTDSLTATVAKISILGYGFMQLRDIFGQSIDISNQYIENLNLFRVTFGSLSDEAERFIETYSNALGLDPSNVMRNMGFFNQIVTGFGISDEEGYKMSKLLTQLAYDLSSFVNIDIEDAMLKFQSGIAGELEPLRRVGYALDEATLQQVAYNHGITESIRTMTQAEKAYLRLITMYEQSENVMGDLAGTLNSPANALRILMEQLNILRRSIGNAMVPIVTKLIPIIQGATKALTEFFNMIAERLGYEVEGARENSYAVYMDNITTSAEEAQNAIEGTLLSFDKFSVLNQQDDEEDFTLPIPDYDALATLADSIADTSESFMNTYNLVANALMNEDRTDFSDTLKGMADLLVTLYNIARKILNEIIIPLMPAINMLVDLVAFFVNILSAIVNTSEGFYALFVGIVLFGIIKASIRMVKGISSFILAIDNLKQKIPPLIVKLDQLIYKFRNLSLESQKTSKEIIKSTQQAGSIVGKNTMTMYDRITYLTSAFTLLTSAVSGAYNLMTNWGNMSLGQKISTVMLTISSAILAVAFAVSAFRTAQTFGTGAVPIIAGILGLIGAFTMIYSQISGFATGGFTPKTSGSLFMAGENGRPELMGTVGGKNAVANVNSIETAMEQASFRGMTMAINQANQSNSNENQDIVLQLDGREIARANVKNTANALSRNYRIELNPR